uniref:Uncharacterized protein n=1 Tax=Romanomermis culicivorax TaxID=13658 RepID=A0A915KRD7_ROMCU
MIEMIKENEKERRECGHTNENDTITIWVIMMNYRPPTRRSLNGQFFLRTQKCIFFLDIVVTTSRVCVQLTLIFIFRYCATTFCAQCRAISFLHVFIFCCDSCNFSKVCRNCARVCSLWRFKEAVKDLCFSKMESEVDWHMPSAAVPFE